MKYVLLLIAAVILLVPTGTTLPIGPITPGPSVDPTPIVIPEPVVVQDTLDTCNASYRQLMADVWRDYAAAYSTYKDDAARLTALNTNQSAAWKAAYLPFTDKAATAAQSATAAEAFSTALRKGSL
jgi:hypothetical protein